MLLLHLLFLKELVLKLEVKVILGSEITLGITPFFLRLHYFIFCHWGIPSNFTGFVHCRFCSACGSWLNPFTQSVYVRSSVSFAICYHVRCWTLNCLDYPPPCHLGSSLPANGISSHTVSPSLIFIYCAWWLYDCCW